MARLFKTSRWLRPYKSKNGHQVFIRVRITNGYETHIPVYDYVNHQKVPVSVFNLRNIGIKVMSLVGNITLVYET